ncbi:MAG: DUF5723 family protein [Spirochaetes bacterium]|nr:DUF5723 family protein [Spirochaetota bacterium]
MRLFCKILFLSLFFQFPLWSINYITTAESISWNGAYTSVADGFEALLYNPAGLEMTHGKFGVNFFGSSGFRFYNNLITSSDISSLIFTNNKSDDADLTTIIANKLDTLSEVGINLGMDLSIANLLIYSKFKKFTFGFSMIPKTTFSFSVGTDILSPIFKGLDISNPIDSSLNVYFLQYLDFCFSLSNRARFLEKFIPVEAIYVGMTQHIYIPTAYFNLSGEVTSTQVVTIPPTSTDLFNFNIKGDAILSTTYVVSQLGNYIPSIPLPSGTNYDLGPAFLSSKTAAFGLGWDFGFIILIKKFLRYGFAINDLGFMVFPRGAQKKTDTNITFSLEDLEDMGGWAMNSLYEVMEGFFSDMERTTTSTYILPSTTVRTGLGILPLDKKNITIIIAADVALSDLNQLIYNGYPTFNFSTGFEINPKINWVEFIFRGSFNYNSQVNYPSLAVGLGLYIGPVQMEFAVKGLEILIKSWGAKEFNCGLDLKLAF